MEARKLTLTADQERARKNIVSRLNMGARYVSLLGYAGTGKTFLASYLLNELGRQGYKTYACAPTHKAAYVLDEKMPIEAETIHTLLGLTLRPNNKGGYYLAKKHGAEVPDEGVVLLDEASMVGKNLWKHIENTAGIQWIFVGDPAQLPPVREKPSPALDQPGAMLNDIVRQEEGNPIIELATAVREGVSYLDEVNYIENGTGVAVTKCKDSFAESALKGFKSWSQNQPPPMRILAYRNDVVQFYNDKMRRLLHGSGRLPRFVRGDWLMMKDSHYENQTPVCRNSEEVKVLRTEESKEVTPAGFFRAHHVTVLRENGQTAILPVLHKSETKRYVEELERFKKEAIGEDRPWTDYYRLKEHFARVDYAFALTVHKSQGSTFHTAYVDHRDLQVCRKESERQALTYVAVTRPSHRLALLTS